jgi:hypothetical protein
MDVPAAQYFIQEGSCRIELGQFVKDCSQYVFARPNPIECNCGFDADYAQNCQLTNSGTSVVIARSQNNSYLFNKQIGSS